MGFYSDSREDVLKAFATDPTHGLNSAQVDKAQKQYGLNALREQKKRSLLSRFWISSRIR